MILKVNNLENKIIDQKGYFKFITTGKCKINELIFIKIRLKLFLPLFFLYYIFLMMLLILYLFMI